MPRKISSIAPGWWDYTTLDSAIIEEVAQLTPEKMLALPRPGFKVVFYDTPEDFYLAEALEYIAAWKQSTHDNPFGQRLTTFFPKDSGCCRADVTAGGPSERAVHFLPGRPGHLRH